MRRSSCSTSGISRARASSSPCPHLRSRQVTVAGCWSGMPQSTPFPACFQDIPAGLVRQNLFLAFVHNALGVGDTVPCTAPRTRWPLPGLEEPDFLTHEAATGSGLGLAIVRDLAENDGGSIALEARRSAVPVHSSRCRGSGRTSRRPVGQLIPPGFAGVGTTNLKEYFVESKYGFCIPLAACNGQPSAGCFFLSW